MEASASSGPVSDTRSCPVCASARTGFFVEKNCHRFLVCADCDLVFIHPVPALEILMALYAGRGAPTDGVRYPFNKEDLRRQRGMIRAFRLKKYFQDKDIIDIGCAGGHMPDAALRMGARTAVGIDIDPEAIDFAEKTHQTGAKFFCEPINDFARRGMMFDFGHSSHVIEHVGDFNEFMAGCAKVIKPGGYFFLKTPDRRHWMTAKAHSAWPNPPQHTQYFGRKSIRLLLEKHGFTVEKFFFTLNPTIEVMTRRNLT